MKTRTFYYDRAYVIKFLSIGTAVFLFLLYVFLSQNVYFPAILGGIVIYCCAVRSLLRALTGIIFQQPAIVLTEQSIFIRRLGYHIHWGDIEHFSMKKRIDKTGDEQGYLIVFELFEPMDYIRKTSNIFSRLRRQVNLSWFDGPFCIDLNVIDGDPVEIITAMRDFYAYHAAQPPINV